LKANAPIGLLWDSISFVVFFYSDIYFLTSKQVTKIKWANPGSVPLKATGVEYVFWQKNQFKYFANARREVIIAAGAIQVRLVVDFYSTRPMLTCLPVARPSPAIRHWRLGPARTSRNPDANRPEDCRQKFARTGWPPLSTPYNSSTLIGTYRL
jgi:hypothetical protein